MFKKLPQQKASIDKNRIWDAIGWHAGKIAEKHRHHDHRNERLEYRPRNADQRLLIAHFQIAPSKKIQKLAVFPDFTEVVQAESFFGLNDGYFFGHNK